MLMLDATCKLIAKVHPTQFITTTSPLQSSTTTINNALSPKFIPTMVLQLAGLKSKYPVSISDSSLNTELCRTAASETKL